ncbi:MAG: hypothetical protein GF419_11340 [Ignavibacteriales bacterium]|nr:hypothetical protein [Ignavibacteriales bacterium]
MKTALLIATTLTIAAFAQPIEPTEEPVPEFLSTPAPNALYEIPVLMISYLPTEDGETMIKEECGTDMPVADMKKKIDSMAIRAKFMLEEGSKFRGYKNPDARPSIGYRVVAHFAAYDYFPRGFEVPWNEGWYRPDYNKVLERFDARKYVEELGVKEIWIWGYHHGEIEPAESNMASPLTGDVSNSEREEEDLPVFDRTYTVYNYNYNRSHAEAVHNHGHQFEAIFTHVCEKQDGNADLFWKLFVGKDGNDEFITGRCGWTHMPPNTTEHYDYLNEIMVPSDVEDWRPTGGATKMVGLATWKHLDYDWPLQPAPFGQKDESQFYIYWFQSFPGYENGIPYGEREMTNWHRFVAEWDEAIQEGAGLYK